ncbi:MAG: ATP-binding cassette domain-containing protein, partial [Proteobacteria bacterium]|nr:ATP-binding cassette domain-containing protein [Pseudomonadota bacterium]
MLEVQNLTKSFGSLVAVSHVSMSVAAGELRAVIGPNGAGKTTFFNMLSGLFPPTTGRILLKGNDITNASVTDRVAMGMARTFQITEIFPELPVRENIRIAVESALGVNNGFWPITGAEMNNEVASR